MKFPSLKQSLLIAWLALPVLWWLWQYINNAEKDRDFLPIAYQTAKKVCQALKEKEVNEVKLDIVWWNYATMTCNTNAIEIEYKRSIGITAWCSYDKNFWNNLISLKPDEISYRSNYLCQWLELTWKIDPQEANNIPPTSMLFWSNLWEIAHQIRHVVNYYK